MNRTFLAAMTVIIILALTGCGNDHNNPPPLIVTQISSNPAIDGYIISNGTVTVIEGMTLSVQSVFAGIDPVTSHEFRAFLDFSLASVPLNAIINSATLDIFIDSVSPGAVIPIRIDLVSFPPPLIPTDFDRISGLPPLASIIGPSLTSANAQTYVLIDVTPLMVTAQNQALPSFQIRILEDLGPVTPGLFEIDDRTSDRATFAPLLTVSFF